MSSTRFSTTDTLHLPNLQFTHHRNNPLPRPGSIGGTGHSRRLALALHDAGRPPHDAAHEPVDLLRRVPRMETHPDAVAALGDRRPRDGARVHAPCEEVRGEGARVGRVEGDDRGGRGAGGGGGEGEHGGRDGVCRELGVQECGEMFRERE